MIEITAITFGRNIQVPQLSNDPRAFLYVGLGGNAGQVTIGKMTVDERNRLLYIEAVGPDELPAPFTWHQPVNSPMGKALADCSKKVVTVIIPDGSAWYCDAVPGRDKKQER